MTIDEAIEHARKNYNEIINTTYNKCQYEHLSCDGCANPTCKEISDENLQIAEWLEELKAYREIGTVEGYKNAIECYTKEYMIRKSNVQYDKAVDDFVHECDKHCEFYSGKNKNITREDILKIAEQLKERNNE